MRRGGVLVRVRRGSVNNGVSTPRQLLLRFHEELSRGVALTAERRAATVLL